MASDVERLVEHGVVPVSIVSESVESCDVQSSVLSSNNESSSYAIPSFQRSVTVQRFIKYLVNTKTFSLGHVKRKIHSFMSQQRDRPPFIQIEKADGRLVRDMFDPILFRAGSTPLPTDSHPLRIAVMIKFHRGVCAQCSSELGGQLSSDCYFAAMIACIECGWNPPIDVGRIVPKYKAPRGHNYKTVEQFHVSTDREFTDMENHGVVVPCMSQGIINPLGSVVKSSDKVRAFVIARVVVNDQASLTRASEFLVSKGHPKIKARIITDPTSTGINSAAYSPAFSYPSLADGLQLLYRSCWLAKADIGRYFHSFPLALECRDLFQVYYREQLWHYARCFFGYTACPYYCSTFSAEIKAWLKSVGVETAHMMDDFLLAGGTLEEAHKKMEVLISVLESAGFYMSADKTEYGQQLVFLGVLIDTVRMILRFEKTQSRGMMVQMEAYLKTLESGGQLDHTTIRHVCGKFNWFSEVVQSGRLHTRAWWLYEKYGSQLHKAWRRVLLLDTRWWISLLLRWSEDESGECEYQIWSASELLERPHSLLIMQSDASGTDGYGYYSGYYSESELQYRYVAVRWQEINTRDSHTIELMCVEDFLVRTQPQDVVLAWITDSESAMWSVNKGRCHEPTAMTVLSHILHMCDMYRVQIVALWVPREENTLADYLSHFAHFSDRDEVEGWLTDLGLSAECSRAASCRDQASQQDS